MGARSHCRLTLALTLPLLLPASSRAQVVRGAVVGPDAIPLAGVVVSLHDTASASVSQTLTNDNGEYRLRAPSAGTYRVSALRIGFRPTTSEALYVALGATVERRLALAGIPLSLEAVRVTGKSSCRVDRDSAAATFTIWQQVRGALAATDLSATERPFTATTADFERTLDPAGKLLSTTATTVRTATVTRPWRSLKPEDARRFGFVVTARDGSTTYHARGSIFCSRRPSPLITASA
jgi:hypothetical protein